MRSDFLIFWGNKRGLDQFHLVYLFSPGIGVAVWHSFVMSRCARLELHPNHFEVQQTSLTVYTGKMAASAISLTAARQSEIIILEHD